MNPKFQCFFNSVFQLIFSIFRNNSYTSLFNSSTEGTLLKCMLQTAHNACNSKDVDALKFQLVRHDIFYNGQIQEDSTECLLMLINIIHKGSMPDSSSTTSPTGASLSDILFSFALEKMIVCDLCGLRSPSFESSSVLYISHTDTSMQNLILEGLQLKLQKSCSRCNKNTRHIELSFILQPPKYLLLFVNRFRYINNNITKDRCPIPMDTTVRLGPLKFSLQATIDHHGPSIDSGHYTASINCCKKHSIPTITKLLSLEFLIKTLLPHILYYINGLTHDFWTRTGGWEFDRSHGAGTSSPSHWQQVEEQAPKPVSWMCFPLMTLVPVQKLCVDIYVYIYMYVHSLYEFCYRSYIQRECHSVLAKLHPITFYRGVRGSWAECHFLFSLVYQLCLAFDINLILGCLWLLLFVLNNILILGIWCSTIPYLPGCFCPWTFFENIGFNMVLTDPFMSHLTTQLGYYAGEFQALQLIVLAAFGVVD